jgi:hypothetical protein
MQSLSANSIKSIAQEAIITQIIKESAKKMFGPTLRLDNDLTNVARSINERIEDYRQTGKDFISNIKPSILMMLKNHSSNEVRKMIVQLLPENLLVHFSQDKSDVVRSHVAKRIDIIKLVEMHKKFPRDYLLTETYNKRMLNEAPKKEEKVQQIEKEDNVNDVELSKTWYTNQANNLLHQYGEFNAGTPRSVDRRWNPLAVKRFCMSTKATSGVVIDEEKLQKAVDDLLDELDDRRANPATQFKAIKESLQRLTEQKQFDVMPMMPIIEETKDYVDELLEISNQTYKFISMFDERFSVVKERYTPTISQLCENIELNDFDVPVTAIVPRCFFDEDVDRAITLYSKKWNKINEDKNIILTWCIDQTDSSKILFDVEKL